MNRRKFLSLSGASVGGMVALAGCSASGTESESEQGTSKFNQDAKPVSETKTVVVDGLKLYSDIDIDGNDFAPLTITGRAKNVSGVEMSIVQIQYGFYDGNNTRIGSGLDMVTELGAGEMWEYEIMYLGEEDSEVKNVEIVGITTT